MTSNIVSETIDAAYPVAGVDNDTQGFRDNFSIIKTGLATAASEVTQLQNSTAKLDASNDFNGTTIADASLTQTTEQYFNAGTKIAGDSISFLNGHYQRIALNLNSNATPGTANFTLSDWPNRDGYAKITVEFRGTAADGDVSVVHTVTLTVEGGGTLKKSGNFPASLTVDSVTNRDNPVIVEFWTVNQGNTVYANYLGVFA
jgi:hypothetical protein